ncbi:MAG TPA: transglutaminase N-terminal domain-containing protein, partial [Verrucomicrobiota bacterium]|nr:transglutaminase N-terminal domain-containing protein [Verrucomicrobiota bacterium]
MAAEQDPAAAGVAPGPGCGGLALRIRHRTRYRYSTPVCESYNEARLQPVTSNGQACDAFELRIAPAGPLRHYRDFYLNCVQYFEVFAPHTELTVEATSLVRTAVRAGSPAPAAFPAARLKECLRIEQCYDFLQMSRNVSLDVPVWKLAQDAAGGVEDAWAAAQAVMGFIHREFTYDATATHVNTHTLEVLRLRRGVC